MPSNNDFMSDLAQEIRGYHQTNNQLLEKLVSNQADATPLIKQPSVEKLDQDNATELDIVNKINELIDVIKASNVTS